MAKCKDCGHKFSEGEGIYVVKVDCDTEYHLCEDCFNEKYANDADFKKWWDEDTKILQMDEEEAEDEYSSSYLEELNLCSHYTTYQKGM